MFSFLLLQSPHLRRLVQLHRLHRRWPSSWVVVLNLLDLFPTIGSPARHLCHRFLLPLAACDLPFFLRVSLASRLLHLRLLHRQSLHVRLRRISLLQWSAVISFDDLLALDSEARHHRRLHRRHHRRLQQQILAWKRVFELVPS